MEDALELMDVITYREGAGCHLTLMSRIPSFSLGFLAPAWLHMSPNCKAEDLQRNDLGSTCKVMSDRPGLETKHRFLRIGTLWASGVLQ